MAILYSFLIMLTFSCGTYEEAMASDPNYNNPDFTVEMHLERLQMPLELRPMVEEYLRLAQARNLNTDGFRTLQAIVYSPSLGKPDTIGLCVRQSNPMTRGFYPTTYILLKQTLTDSYLKQILFHELTHCIFDIGHSDDSDNIMYPTASINPSDFSNYYDYYIDSMFDFVEEALCSK